MARKVKWGNLLGLIAVVGGVGAGGWYVLQQPVGSAEVKAVQKPAEAPVVAEPKAVEAPKQAQPEPVKQVDPGLEAALKAGTK